MADRAPSVPISSALPAAKTTLTTAPPRPAPRVSSLARFGDRIYAAVTFLASLSIFAIILWLVWQLTSASLLSIHHTGFSFITQSDWNEEKDSYHALPFISGNALLVVYRACSRRSRFISARLFSCPSWLRAGYALPRHS